MIFLTAILATAIGGASASDPPNPGVFLTSVEEARSVSPSYFWDSATSSVTDRDPHPHALRLGFNVSYPVPPEGHYFYRSYGVLTPAELGRKRADGVIYIENPAPSGTGYVIWVPWNDTTLDVHMTPDPEENGQSPLSPQTVTVVVWDHHVWYVDQEMKQHYTCYFLEYEVLKIACADASVDSRVGYPQSSNDTFLYGTDPNGTPRNYSFGTWEFRGGLFAGNMYWNGYPQDQSGTARMQFWPDETPAAEDIGFAALSLLDCGQVPLHNGQYLGGPDLGLFSPDPTNDPNLSATEGSVVWSTRWTSIAPRGTAQSPYPVWLDPMDHKAISSTPPEPKEYVSWSLTRIGQPFADPHEPYTPAGALQHLCLAICDEATFVGNSSSAWAYFASNEFATHAPETFPESDSAPRLWVVKKPVISIVYDEGD